MKRDFLPLRDALRIPQGPVDLDAYDPSDTPGFADTKGGKKAKKKSGKRASKKAKKAGKKQLAALADPLSDLQERLFAHGLTGGTRRVLLVLQGMDTSGKGGITRHAVGLVDPQGVDITSFKAPTRSEKRHDFLWRVERAVPGAGMIGIFDRSHYEDVLIGRVRELADPEEIERRYDAINDFEQRLADDGVVILKCMLHVSKDKQKERLLARLDDPEKFYKFNPGDIDERALWDDYRRAYDLVLQRCNTDAAPWYLIPADRKWYRNWAIGTLLRETLEDLNLTWPEADFDVKAERKRLRAT